MPNLRFSASEVPPRIRNIWGIGRNYADHAKELGNAAPAKGSDEPLVFLKAGSSVVLPGHAIRLPTWSRDVHHEVEVAVRFGHGLKLAQYAVALDLTARDAQSRLKASGQPWTLAKSFTDSCPLGPLHPIDEGLDLQALDFWLDVNGERRQTGSTREMAFSVAEIAHYVRARFPVEEGDLLLTGTPAGVGALRPGDRIAAGLQGRGTVAWNCVLATE
jgi:2-keto-4-pentenoate hydratase/2-oxohepta-3-ene-1,7-dioic acid hydratase in catechol pathway